MAPDTSMAMRNKIALLIAGDFFYPDSTALIQKAYSLETEPRSLGVIRKIYNKSQSWQTRRRPGPDACLLALS